MSRVHRLFGTWRALRRAALGAAVALVLVPALEHASGGVLHGALFLLPAAAIALALWRGWYPGERILDRLRAAPTAGPERPCGVRTPRWLHADLLRGGRLIAVSLAGRAPPAAAACC
jgi:hypothetical protein